jgi:hypothetical protein
MALAHLLGRVDALTLEGRRHPDVGDQHLRIGGGGTVDRLVVVGGYPHDVQVGLPVDEGAHPFANDQVVVREEDRDRARCLRIMVVHLPSCRT